MYVWINILYVSMYVRVYLCRCVCVCVCVCMYARTRVCVSMHVFTYVGMYMCMRACVYAHICECVHLRARTKSDDFAICFIAIPFWLRFSLMFVWLFPQFLIVPPLTTVEKRMLNLWRDAPNKRARNANDSQTVVDWHHKVTTRTSVRIANLRIYLCVFSYVTQMCLNGFCSIPDPPAELQSPRTNIADPCGVFCFSCKSHARFRQIPSALKYGKHRNFKCPAPNLHIFIFKQPQFIHSAICDRTETETSRHPDRQTDR